MEVPLIVGLTIVAVIIALVVVNHKVIQPWRKRVHYQAWQEERRNQWLAQFKQADTDAKLAKLYAPHKHWANGETKQAAKKIEEARSREKARILAEDTAQAQAFYDQLRQLSDPRERWRVIGTAPHSAWFIADGKIGVRKYRKQGVKQYVTLLVQEARDGNAASFREAAATVLGRRSIYDAYADEPYAFPADWDELMTTFYKNPSVDDFANQPQYDSSEILLVATEASRTRNFVVAKLVLAYSMVSERHESGYGASRHSQKYWPYRAAVGEFLLTELATFVDGVHVQRGLFQDQVTAPTITD